MSVKLFEPSLEPWTPAADPERNVAVLMSGGVDSSVSAQLLKNEGWQVLGVTMKVPVLGACRHPSPCCGADAALVCHRIGIPHYFVDIHDDFHEFVVQSFRNAYAEGRTPNPCVDCNTFLKFGAVWDLLEKELAIRHLATGHYAAISHHAGAHFLCAGQDRRRDQSYFIYGLPRLRLPYFHLPVGNLDKDAVRQLAVEFDLGVADKPDSMELCFAGEGDYRRALGIEDEGEYGIIQDTHGNVLGHHQGVWNYTIGQRRGLGIAAPQPLYVIAIDAGRNIVTVGLRNEASRHEVRAGQLNVLIPELLREKQQLQGKIRSYSPPSPCCITALTPSTITVSFEHPQFAPTPGQHLVLYDEQDRVVAGGRITPEG